jgi:hypothetical protein
MSLTKVSSAVLNVDDLYGFRNRIINGDMRIDQRNAGASVTPTSNSYTLDRWTYAATQASKFSLQQNAGSVTPPVGFVNYLGLTSLSAYSILTSDLFGFQQRIEGFNTSDLAWGTANADSVTLSFWVRSSLTGTFGGAVRNHDASRSQPFSYTVSAANTWEYKTVTLVGDTSGTWLTTNGLGISLFFSLGAGSTVSNTPGTWYAGSFVAPTGSTSVVGTSGATLYITGVQLEKGTVATPFERRPFGMELALCQRYFQLGSGATGTTGNTTTNFYTSLNYTVPMRASPTLSQTGVLTLSAPAVNDYTQSSINSTLTQATTTGAFINFGNFSGLTAHRPYLMQPVFGGNTFYYTFSAEL